MNRSAAFIAAGMWGEDIRPPERRPIVALRSVPPPPPVAVLDPFWGAVPTDPPPPREDWSEFWRE